MRRHITVDAKPVTVAVLHDAMMALALRHSASRPAPRASGNGRIPPDVRYAILRSPLEKPTAFADLASLTRRIHRDRGYAPLQLANATIYIPGEASGRSVVKVVTLCEGSPYRDLGYVWVGDVQSPREVLSAALHATQPRLFEAAA